MIRLEITFIFLFLVSTIEVLSAKKQKETNDSKTLGWQDCMGQKIDTSQLLSANNTCRAELKIDEKLEDRKVLEKKCFRICQLRKLGFITANDTIDSSKVSIYVDAIYPSSTRTPIKDAITSCGTSVKVGPAESNCSHYKLLIKCINKSVRQSCKAVPTGNSTSVSSPNVGTNSSISISNRTTT